MGVLCLATGGKKFVLGQAQNKVKYITHKLVFKRMTNTRTHNYKNTLFLH